MAQPYSTVPYSRQALADLLVAKSHGQNEFVRERQHVSYLDEYFSAVGAKTILVEEQYVDRDFLEDFAAYHVRCFVDYKRLCARLHFFADALDPDHLDQVLRRAIPADVLQRSYLGFVVLKPLPQTIVGRTCLATYPARDGQRTRHFPATREERVNLFGVDLSLQSLPFQEQDNDVAACASSALWSVLNSTGRLFQHQIPSPVEITRAAAQHSRVDDRNFPAGNGLNAYQIADAIRSVGLEPHAVRTSDPIYLRLAAAAYLHASIPSVLLARLERQTPGAAPVLLGRHAMAVVGYGIPDAAAVAPTPMPGTGRLLRASAIDRLYCHDDQVGPFAKLRFLPGGGIGTSWGLGGPGPVYVAPENLIVPLYHKIRVPFSAVFEAAQVLDEFIEVFRMGGLLPLSNRVTWDLRLTDVNPFRRDLFRSAVDDANRLRLLRRNYPKYMWRLGAADGGSPLFDMLFDATDLLQGQHLVDVVPHDATLCRALSVVAHALPADATAGNARLAAVVRWFVDNAAHLP